MINMDRRGDQEWKIKRHS